MLLWVRSVLRSTDKLTLIAIILLAAGIDILSLNTTLRQARVGISRRLHSRAGVVADERLLARTAAGEVLVLAGDGSLLRLGAPSGAFVHEGGGLAGEFVEVHCELWGR